MPTTLTLPTPNTATLTATTLVAAGGAVPKPGQVGMGDIQAGKGSEKLVSVLGSCVGLVLYHPRCRAGALAHVVLPDSAGKTGAAGKFADTAVPRMLMMLAELGIPAAGIAAKLTGGANMFGSTGPLQIGEQNLQALRAILRRLAIPIAAESVGGNKGRRVTLDCTTGELLVEVAGFPLATL